MTKMTVKRALNLGFDLSYAPAFQPVEVLCSACDVEWVETWPGSGDLVPQHAAACRNRAHVQPVLPDREEYDV